MLQTCRYNIKMYILSKIHIKLFQILKWVRYIHEYTDTFKCKKDGQERKMFNWRCVYNTGLFKMIVGALTTCHTQYT